MNGTEWLILTIAITQVFTLYLIYNLSCMFTKMVEHQKEQDEAIIDLEKELEELNK